MLKYEMIAVIVSYFHTVNFWKVELIDNLA